MQGTHDETAGGRREVYPLHVPQVHLPAHHEAREQETITAGGLPKAPAPSGATLPGPSGVRNLDGLSRRAPFRNSFEDPVSSRFLSLESLG